MPKSSTNKYRYRRGTGFGRRDSFLESTVIVSEVTFGRIAEQSRAAATDLVDWRREAVSRLLWSDKDREVWFFLEKNHEKVYRFGLHQLRNCFGGRSPQGRRRRQSGWRLMAFILYGAQRGT